MQECPAVGDASPIVKRLTALGITAGADLDAFWRLLTVQSEIGPSQSIVSVAPIPAHFTVLLKGVARRSTRHQDGVWQIEGFCYPGDFLELDRVVFPQSVEPYEVQALTGCTVGRIERQAFDQAMHAHPALGRALWRAAMIEASIHRQRLFVARRPALQRVAHLLCEQLARLGIDEGLIPLSQTDVAGAERLSVVHANRIFDELRELGALSKQRIEVVDGSQLRELAAFDGRYLDPRGWDLRFEVD